MFHTYSYTPADNSLTGYLSNATGATWTLSSTSAGDGLAHLVTIRNDTANDHSLKTAVITGTDQDGKVLIETLALPGVSATVTSTKYFLTVTSVVPSATIGADTMDIGYSDVCVGPTYPVNYRQNPVNIGMQITITGTISYTIQHTLDDPFSSSQSAVWANHDSLAAATASADGNYAYPLRAVRLLINSSTSGATIKFRIVQGRP